MTPLRARLLSLLAWLTGLIQPETPPPPACPPFPDLSALAEVVPIHALAAHIEAHLRDPTPSTLADLLALAGRHLDTLGPHPVMAAYAQILLTASRRVASVPSLPAASIPLERMCDDLTFLVRSGLSEAIDQLCHPPRVTGPVRSIV